MPGNYDFSDGNHDFHFSELIARKARQEPELKGMTFRVRDEEHNADIDFHVTIGHVGFTPLGIAELGYRVDATGYTVTATDIFDAVRQISPHLQAVAIGWIRHPAVPVTGPRSLAGPIPDVTWWEDPSWAGKDTGKDNRPRAVTVHATITATDFRKKLKDIKPSPGTIIGTTAAKGQHVDEFYFDELSFDENDEGQKPNLTLMHPSSWDFPVEATGNLKGILDESFWQGGT